LRLAQLATALALAGATVWASPCAQPVRNAIVVVSDGVITAVGERDNAEVPHDTLLIDCTGKTILAGFGTAVWDLGSSRDTLALRDIFTRRIPAPRSNRG
jgi:hypothetical protein